MKKFLLAMLLVAATRAMAFGGEITLSEAVYTDDGSEIVDLLMMEPSREVEFTFTITDFSLPLYYQATISTVGGSYYSFGATRNNLNPISISKSGGFSPGDSGTVSLGIYDNATRVLIDEETMAIAAKGETPGPGPGPGPGPNPPSDGGCNAGMSAVIPVVFLVFQMRLWRKKGINR